MPETKERDNHWIITYTGRKFWPLDPRPEDVCIEDIAHALSNICRFTGHCLQFYSVAQHSVLVSEQTELFPFIGLLHDSAEAYLGDMSRPMKRSVLGEAYRCYEANLQSCIFEAFGIEKLNGDAAEIIREVKDCDNRMLATEKRDIVVKHTHVWTDIQAENSSVVPFPFTICPQDQKTAEAYFLMRFYALKNRV